MNARLECIPAFLDQRSWVSVGWAFDGCVVNYAVATVGEGAAFHRDNRRAGALGKGDMGWSDARNQAAECGDRHGALARVNVQVDENPKFPARFEMLEHFNHRAFLRDNSVASAGTKMVEDGAEERVFEFLGDYWASRDRVGTDKREPLEIRKMHATINRGFFGVFAVGVVLPAFEDDVVANEFLGDFRSPEELEHRAGECAVGASGDPVLADFGKFAGEGGFNVLQCSSASARIEEIDHRSDEVGERSESAEFELGDEPCGRGEASVFKPVAEGMVHSWGSMRGNKGTGSPS